MIKINLLPKEARKRIGVMEQIFILAFILIMTLVGIGVAWGYLNSEIEERKTEIARTNKRLEELKKVIAEIQAFESQLAALQQKLEIIAKLQKEQQLPVHLLDELYMTLEGDLWLSSFTFSGDTFNLAGTALSDPVIAAYMRKLENSVYFANVELLFSRIVLLGKQEARDFQIVMKLTVPPTFDSPPTE